MEKTCPQCGCQFVDDRRKDKQRTYCTRHCAMLANWIKRHQSPQPHRFTGFTVSCVMCGKPIYQVPSHPRKYCSVACFAASKVIPNEERSCLKCGVRFTPSGHNRDAKYCGLACARKHVAELRRQVEGGFLNSRLAKSVLTKEIGRCQRCGYSDELGILEIHHIDRNPRHCSRDNLILLCPNCHSIDHLRNGDGQFANNKGRNGIHRHYPS